MKKAHLAILILVSLLMASCFGNIILGIRSSGIKSPTLGNILKIGILERNFPAVLDPIDSWDSVSNDMIRHVCDTLWSYDLVDPKLPITMRLATSYFWNAEMDELTVSLRNDVWFHNGAKFNATAVKFTFDRITYFINASGTLPDTTHVCDPSYLFFNMDGNPILNRIEIIDEYTIKLILNKPNSFFIPVLSYEACSILHPNSTPAKEYLEFQEEDILIGTGPFKYVYLIPGDELRIERFNMYWGSATYWDEIIWMYYPDTTTINNALLDGKVDYLRDPLISLIPTFQADDNIIIVEMNTSTTFRYWAINNDRINDTNIRKAMAYAYNYSNFIEEFQQGYAIEAEQFLPPGFPFYNASFKAPYYNISIARQTLKEAFPIETVGLTAQAYGENSTNDDAWSNLILATYTFDPFAWSHPEVTQRIINALFSDMDKIGIEMGVVSWNQYIFPYNPPPIWYTAWWPDYLDPFNMLEPILNNMSSSSYLQNNDYLIHKWLKQYEDIDPTNITGRKELVYKIQQRAINELYLLLPISFDKTYFVHHRSLGGVGYNIQGNLWLTDSYFIPGIPRAK